MLKPSGPGLGGTAADGDPGGKDTEIQYNDKGEFNGDSTFTFTEDTFVVTIQELLVTDNATIEGNLTVKGNIVNDSTVNLNIENNHINLNFGYQDTTPEQTAIVSTINAVSNKITEGTDADFVSSTRVTFTAATAISLASGDIIQISTSTTEDPADPTNNGLYEVDSYTSGDLVIKSTSLQPWLDDSFDTLSTDDIIHLAQVNVTVLLISDDVMEIGAGSSTTGFTYERFLTTKSVIEFIDGSMQLQAASRNDVGFHVDTFTEVGDQRSLTKDNIAFDMSGLILLEVDSTTSGTNRTITSFDLTNQYDISAVSLRGSVITLTDGIPSWALFSLKGDKLFVGFSTAATGTFAGVIYQYDLATAFTPSSSDPSFVVTAANGTIGESAYFVPDGKTLLIVGTTGSLDEIQIISLVDAYDFSAGSSIETPYDISLDFTSITGIDHKSNGYIGVLTGDGLINEFRLPVPYNWSPANRESGSSTGFLDATSIVFSLDGRRAFVTNSTDGATVYDVGIKAQNRLLLESTNPALESGNVIGGIFFKALGNPTTPNAQFIIPASITAVSNSGVTTAAVPTDLVFSTDFDSSPAERMRITSAGFFGLGTASPEKFFHVKESTSGGGFSVGAAIDFIVENSSSSILQVLGGNSGTDVKAVRFGDRDSLAATSSAEIGYTGALSDGTLSISTGSVKRLTILGGAAEGFVGIGPAFTTPSTLLHLRAAGSTQIAPTADTILLVENNDDADITILTPVGNTGKLIFGNNNNNNRARLSFTAAGDNTNDLLISSDQGTIKIFSMTGGSQPGLIVRRGNINFVNTSAGDDDILILETEANNSFLMINANDDKDAGIRFTEGSSFGQKAKIFYNTTDEVLTLETDSGNVFVNDNLNVDKEVTATLLNLTGKDAFFNSGVTTDIVATSAGLDGGIVVNRGKVTNTDTVFTAGVFTTTTLLLDGTIGPTYLQDDFIQISGTKFNDGIYEVDTFTTPSNDLITIKITGTESWIKTAFVAGTDAGTVVNANVTVIKSDPATGLWTEGKGSSSQINYNSLTQFPFVVGTDPALFTYTSIDAAIGAIQTAVLSEANIIVTAGTYTENPVVDVDNISIFAFGDEGTVINGTVTVSAGGSNIQGLKITEGIVYSGTSGIFCHLDHVEVFSTLGVSLLLTNTGNSKLTANTCSFLSTSSSHSFGMGDGATMDGSFHKCIFVTSASEDNPSIKLTTAATTATGDVVIDDSEIHGTVELGSSSAVEFTGDFTLTGSESFIETSGGEECINVTDYNGTVTVKGATLRTGLTGFPKDVITSFGTGTGSFEFANVVTSEFAILNDSLGDRLSVDGVVLKSNSSLDGTFLNNKGEYSISPSIFDTRKTFDASTNTNTADASGEAAILAYVGPTATAPVAPIVLTISIPEFLNFGNSGVIYGITVKDESGTAEDVQPIQITTSQITITSVAAAAGSPRFTTSAAHNLVTGSFIRQSTFLVGDYNGVFEVTFVSTTQYDILSLSTVSDSSGIAKFSFDRVDNINAETLTIDANGGFVKIYTDGKSLYTL